MEKHWIYHSAGNVLSSGSIHYGKERKVIRSKSTLIIGLPSIEIPLWYCWSNLLSSCCLMSSPIFIRSITRLLTNAYVTLNQPPIKKGNMMRSSHLSCKACAVSVIIPAELLLLLVCTASSVQYRCSRRPRGLPLLSPAPRRGATCSAGY